MKATEKQEAFLKQLKLPVPPNHEAASRLLSFALHGNDNCEEDAQERRALIRECWENWVGKLVKVIHRGHRFQGVCGRVEYLQARMGQEIREIIATHSARNPLPFVAVVRLDPASAKVFTEVHLTGLKRVEETQGRLFPP